MYVGTYLYICMYVQDAYLTHRLYSVLYHATSCIIYDLEASSTFIVVPSTGLDVIRRVNSEMNQCISQDPVGYALWGNH